MSNYDPPQQPWGGPPQDPYGAPQYPHDPTSAPPGGGYPPPPPPTTAFPGGGYPPPGDPYGGGAYPPVSGGGGYPPPGGGGGFPPPGGGYPPPGGGYPPPQPSRGGGSGKIIIAIVAVVVLALCCGGGFVAYKYVNDESKKTANPGSSTGPTTPGSSGASSGSTRSTPPTRTTPPTTGNGGLDPDTLVKGDCFINQGTDDSPKLAKVSCSTTGSYEVIFKIPFTADKKRCDDPGVGKYDASYTHDENPGSTGDYVLCLKKH